MNASTPEPWTGPGARTESGQRANSQDPNGESARLDLTPRPFLLTLGRTQGISKAIAVETQVVATEHGLAASQRSAFERRAIVELCREPSSVAEISARLRLHLNVARVLVSDLYADRYVIAHLPDFDAARDVDTLRRVIRGLRAIS